MSRLGEIEILLTNGDSRDTGNLEANVTILTLFNDLGNGH